MIKNITKLIKLIISFKKMFFFNFFNHYFYSLTLVIIVLKKSLSAIGEKKLKLILYGMYVYNSLDECLCLLTLLNILENVAYT